HVLCCHNDWSLLQIQERSASLETCPWCAAKGQTRALRSYRISIQEVITLCTDPQCLFPLVSRPLEDVLASLRPYLSQGRRPYLSPGEEALPVPGRRPYLSQGRRPYLSQGRRPYLSQGRRPYLSQGRRPYLSQGRRPYLSPGEGGPTCPRGGGPTCPRGRRPYLSQGRRPYLSQGRRPYLSQGRRPYLSQGRRPYLSQGGGPTCPRGGGPTCPRGRRPYLSQGRRPYLSQGRRPYLSQGEEALPVPGEEALPVPGEEALPVPGEEALPVPGEEALPVPGEEALPVPGEEALPVPGEEALPVPGEEALPVPGGGLPVPGEEALPVPGEEALPRRLYLSQGRRPYLSQGGCLSVRGGFTCPREAVSLLEEAPPVPGEEDAEGKEPVPTVEAVLVLQEALTVLEEASPGMKEGLSVLQKEDEEELVLIASEEEEEVAALVALEAVSIPAMVEVVPALEKDEEDLLVFDGEEKIQDEERPPAGVCRPCSVDLSQSKVHDGQEDDGPIRARRRAHNARQLSDEDEEQEVSVKEEVEVLTPAPKKKRGRPRKTPIIKYTQEVLPDFDPGLISTGELVPVPGPHLFWKNEHSLGWLDTLLVALVHCRTLRDRRPIKRPTVGQPVWDLCERYDRACSLSTAYQHTGADGVVRVPSAVSQRVQTEMQAIRTAIFKLLEPLLKCKLGQNERLVFVLPLLLGADSWAERLFQHECDWQFQCNSAICRHATQTKCNKTLTTFTKVVSDWHPLNAANQSRCSKCNKMKQARMLVLE
ncbi:SUMO-specific isopeptidase USPL1-like, partial [Oncorhynchus masou masou]|uniref:SUMO-specific isopeptidase USPL1-like n=1 Tax=Oncorhynchus masou masou TaxID=90313 RepID=UPI003184232F